MALTAVGVAATLGVFGAAGRTTVISQNTEVGAQQAQAELDRLSKLKYGELALTSTPVASTNVKNPNYRVSGSNFNVRTGLTEPLVTTAGDGATAKVDPGPTDFAVGQNGSTITGKIYRYVTWRDENCPATHLRRHPEHQARDRRGQPGPGREHRPAQPAVVLDRDQRSERSTPRLHGHGRRKRVRDGGSTSAQIFYLYDEACDDADWDGSGYNAPTGSHDTRNTAQIGASPSSNSTCANTDSMKQPDSMGIAARQRAIPARRSTSTRPISPATTWAASRWRARGAPAVPLTRPRRRPSTPPTRARPATSTRCMRGPRRRWRMRRSISAGGPRCPSGRRPWVACPAEASCARR